MNTTTSMLAFVNTISRLAGSKNSGWKRSPCGLGGFAGSYVVRAVRLSSSCPTQLRAPAIKSGRSSRTGRLHHRADPEMDALTDHLFLPEKEELDKLLRYEAMINRATEPCDRRAGEGAGAQEGRDLP